MSRWFNIGGPCIAAKHYMLPASKKLPDVWSLIRKEQYFVVHAPRQYHTMGTDPSRHTPRR